jgi:hypothetical protein
MFSDSMVVGLSMLVLTMVMPIVGLSGLLGLLVALLASRLTGFEGWDSKSGVLGFNSLLIGLTIGYYYPYSNGIQNPVHLIGLIIIASLATQMLYLGLSYLTQQWFRMPSMSLAFSITALFFWFYLVRSGYFTGIGFMKPMLWDVSIVLPTFWKDYFVALGSILFVPDVLVGIIMTLVLLSISRIAFLLSLFGWTICYILLQHSNMGATYGMFFPGFNLILISLAIGSVFLIPGKSSYLLAILGVVFGFLLAYALSGKYYYPDVMPNRADVLYVPMFAFPMNLVVITMIFALRLRVRQSSPIINDYGILHPEKALDAYLSRYRRFQSAGVPQIHMPVNGEWKVTQGHNGDHTHKSDWAYAWDFEILDAKGKKYSGQETELRDYYCFGKPVHAAAAGEVAKIVSSVPDNAIGGLNTKDNWGNYITINHGYGFYTLYAHLKEGSIKLSEGDRVKQGEKIGMVGNSGRSPVPHLHFQAQMGIDAGSKTIFSHIINFKVDSGTDCLTFVSSGVPKAEDTVSRLVPEHDLATILQLGYGQTQSFSVETTQATVSENWEVKVDLLGTHTLISDSGTKLDFSIYNGIYNSLSLTGRRNTALAGFAVAASRLPWVENQDICWKDEPALSVMLNPFWKNLTLFFIPFFKPIRVQTASKLVSRDGQITLESDTVFSVLGIRISRSKAILGLSRKDGLKEISLEREGKLVLRARRQENSLEENNAN